MVQDNANYFHTHQQTALIAANFPISGFALNILVIIIEILSYLRFKLSYSCPTPTEDTGKQIKIIFARIYEILASYI